LNFLSILMILSIIVILKSYISKKKQVFHICHIHIVTSELRVLERSRIASYLQSSDKTTVVTPV
jgi:hypothetical protein